MTTLVVHTLMATVIKDREAGLKEAVRACYTIALAERSVGGKQITPPDAAHPHTTKKRRTSNKNRYGKNKRLMLTKLQWALKNPLGKQALDQNHHHP